MPPPSPDSFPRHAKLKHALDFARVLEQGRRVTVGPLAVTLLWSELTHARLGIRIARRVGNSPQRNHIKRLLREAFRVSTLKPIAIDILISVRPHAALTLTQYQQHFSTLLTQLPQRPHNPMSDNADAKVGG